MQLKRLLAASFLCICMAPSSQGFAQIGAEGQAPPAAGSMGAVSHDPAVAATIKKAAEAQGEISPYTLKALERDPKAMEVMGRAPSGNSGGQPAPQANPGAGPKSTKAMYGDIIIHK